MGRPRSTRICSVEGCEKSHKSKGYCRNHWRKFCKTEGSTITNKCGTAGCDKVHYAKGYCRKHYRQMQELGYDAPVPDRKLCKECNEPFKGKYVSALFCSVSCKMKLYRREGCYTADHLSRNRPVCSVRGCDKPVHSGMVCNRHNLRRLRHGEPEGGLPMEAPNCSHDDCDEVAGRVSGLCPRHYHNEYYYANHKVEKARRNARRSRVKEATPPWVDMIEIRKIYEECPEGFEVDHIHPLKGKDFRGLHVPWNLQYLTIHDNREKSNKM